MTKRTVNKHGLLFEYLSLKDENNSIKDETGKIHLDTIKSNTKRMKEIALELTMVHSTLASDYTWKDMPMELIHGFNKFRWQGKIYTPNLTQANALQFMYDQKIAGEEAIHHQDILNKINISGRIQDVFKGSPLWKSLIIMHSKGYYKLALEF